MRSLGGLGWSADGPLGPWLAPDWLLYDTDAYHAAAAEGPPRAAPFTPTAVARMWLASFDDNASATLTTTTRATAHRERDHRRLLPA